MHILLVRHGETTWNRDGRYQGRTDVPLSADGERQVRALGARLVDIPIAVAIASPLSRARVTAEAIVGNRGLALTLEPALVEISHGGWEGQLASDVMRDHPAMLTAWRAGPPRDFPAGPGAESLGAVEDRAWPVLASLCAQLGADQVGLLVAHDAVNRVLLCRVLGLPIERVWSFRQSPATLNVLAGPSLDELQVVRLNDSEHVAPLLAETVHRAL